MKRSRKGVYLDAICSACERPYAEHLKLKCLFGPSQWTTDALHSVHAKGSPITCTACLWTVRFAKDKPRTCGNCAARFTYIEDACLGTLTFNT